MLIQHVALAAATVGVVTGMAACGSSNWDGGEFQGQPVVKVNLGENDVFDSDSSFLNSDEAMTSEASDEISECRSLLDETLTDFEDLPLEGGSFEVESGGDAFTLEWVGELTEDGETFGVYSVSCT